MIQIDDEEYAALLKAAFPEINSGAVGLSDVIKRVRLLNYFYKATYVQLPISSGDEITKQRIEILKRSGA